MNDVIKDVMAEMSAQLEKWGEQNHPDGSSTRYTPLADIFRSIADNNAAEGALTWHDILSEEFYEAIAEEDPEKLRTELVQVAAVALTWCEAIDRRSE